MHSKASQGRITLVNKTAISHYLPKIVKGVEVMTDSDQGRQRFIYSFLADIPDGARCLQTLNGRFPCFALISYVSPQKSLNIHAIYHQSTEPTIYTLAPGPHSRPQGPSPAGQTRGHHTQPR